MFRVPLCLLAGVVVAWVGAWACTRVRAEQTMTVSTPPGLQWAVEVPAGWPAPTNLGRMESAVQTFEVRGTAFISGEMTRVDAYGWPWRALRYEEVHDATRLYRSTAWQPPGWLPPGPLPTEIIPIGFTLNALLATVVLLVLWAVPSFARRRLRSAKGLCLQCGYDRRGHTTPHAPCPECGTPAHPSPTRPPVPADNVS
jgi:hypothetical protein